MRIAVHIRGIERDGLAEGRVGRAETETHVGEEHLVGNERGDLPGHIRHDDGDEVRQDVSHDHRPRPGAEALGRHVVLTVADDHDLRADKVRDKDPLGTRHRDNERAHTGAEDVGEDHGEQQERDVGNDVVDLDHPLVHLLGEAPERADRNADEHIDGRADEGDDDGVSRARPDSVKYLVADVVGAEDVLGARL